MRVLVACEFSGIVREAFKAHGHDAWSCDLLPTEIPGQHIQGDVLAILNYGWDLMIAHPPCTYLSYAGIGWFNEEKWGERARLRKIKREEAAEFFMRFYNVPIPKICVENPVGYMNSTFRKSDQKIQPYFWGDPHVKGTCLWLKNLPLLEYDKTVQKPPPLAVQTRRPSKWYIGGETKNRYFVDVKSSKSAHERSRTFPGIANAMAEQWGNA
jgi:hypothetical protein